jgi:hypothetical protein
VMDNRSSFNRRHSRHGLDGLARSSRSKVAGHVHTRSTVAAGELVRERLDWRCCLLAACPWPRGRGATASNSACGRVRR